MDKLKNNSIGENLVRVKFNPSDDDIIYRIKQKHAELINLIHELELKDCPGEFPKVDMENFPDGSHCFYISDEFKSLKKRAIIKIEESSMWATKAITVKL